MNGIYMHNLGQDTECSACQMFWKVDKSQVGLWPVGLLIGLQIQKILPWRQHRDLYCMTESKLCVSKNIFLNSGHFKKHPLQKNQVILTLKIMGGKTGLPI